MNWQMGFFFKKNIKKAAILGALAVCFVCGFLLVFYSWDGKVYVYLGEGKFRDLAQADAQGSDSSFVELSRKELAQQGSNQLFAKSKIDREGPLLKFYLGNFIIPDRAEGKYFFVCQFYDYVEMTFKGLDSGVSGNIGSMVLQAPCLMEGEEEAEEEEAENRKKKEEFIGPFYFPLEDVLRQSDKEDILQQPDKIKMEFALEEKDTLVRFHKMAPSMNDNWLLTVARFFNSPDEDGFFVYFTPGEESPYFELQFRTPDDESL